MKSTHMGIKSLIFHVIRDCNHIGGNCHCLANMILRGMQKYDKHYMATKTLTAHSNSPLYTSVFSAYFCKSKVPRLLLCPKSVSLSAFSEATPGCPTSNFNGAVELQCQ